MLASFLSTISPCRGSFQQTDPDASHTELNEYLQTLVELFPEADVEDIRERLIQSSAESRLFLVTESLLIVPSKGNCPTGKPKIDPADMFRSRVYQNAVRTLLHTEFKGLSKSTIQAVMVEKNHDYRKSRTTLSEISSKSWRFSVSAFFRRKKTETAGSVLDARSVGCGCEELDGELRELVRDQIEAQIAEDCKLSALLDEAEHAAASDLICCETCYGDYSWNQIAACSAGHFTCYECLTRSLQENVYGQGQSVTDGKFSVRCISAAATPTCNACIPPDVLVRAVPEDLIRAMEEKLAMENLERSGLSLVRCPFCSYAEVDELQPYKLKPRARICAFLMLLLFYVYVSNQVILAFLFLFLFTYLITPFLPPESEGVVISTIELLSLHKHWQHSVKSLQLKRRGTLFKCRNDRCRRESCIRCSKEWSAFHKCYEKEEDSVRTYVEKAMANAVKRTCPVCRISFVKADGCNKLTCVCGYIMCYICRADIREEGYRHFCQHFRQIPGTTCTDCEKCDLYVQEDEDTAIREAAKKAEEEYFRTHEVPVTWQCLKEKVGPVSLENSLGVWFIVRHIQKWWDGLLEEIIIDVKDPIVQV